MINSKPLVNRVAKSGIITFNLEDYFPEGEVVTFDLKPYLFRELILKEKDFRAALKALDWSQYEGKHLLIICSSDAIIPVWAYMLVTSYAEPIAKSVFQGTPEAFYQQAYEDVLKTLDVESYRDKRLVIKGCSNRPVPVSAYVRLTQLLRPVAKRIMYGEPCSTVPIYKKSRKI